MATAKGRTLPREKLQAHQARPPVSRLHGRSSLQLHQRASHRRPVAPLEGVAGPDHERRGRRGLASRGQGRHRAGPGIASLRHDGRHNAPIVGGPAGERAAQRPGRRFFPPPGAETLPRLDDLEQRVPTGREPEARGAIARRDREIRVMTRVVRRGCHGREQGEAPRQPDDLLLERLQAAPG